MSDPERARIMSSLEQDDERSTQVRDTGALAGHRDQKNDAGRSEVEEYKNQDELPERRDGRYKTDKTVHDTAEENWWDDAKR